MFWCLLFEHSVDEKLSVGLNQQVLGNLAVVRKQQVLQQAAHFQGFLPVFSIKTFFATAASASAGLDRPLLPQLSSALRPLFLAAFVQMHGPLYRLRREAKKQKS